MIGGFSKKYVFIVFRNSLMQMFFKTVVARNCAMFTGKHLCWSLFLIKNNLNSTFSQRRLQHRWFLSCENCEIFTNTFFMEYLQWLFLSVWYKTIQWWASADLLFLIKNIICGMVSTKKVCRSGQSMLCTHY